MMFQLRESCSKAIPCPPDGFDEWFALVMMVKEHVYWFSTCKGLRGAYAETHRRLKLRFIHWPLFSRAQRLRAVIPMLRVGDDVRVETLGWPHWFNGRVARTNRATITFNDQDDNNEEPMRVRVNRITYVQLLWF